MVGDMEDDMVCVYMLDNMMEITVDAHSVSNSCVLQAMPQLLMN